MLLFWNSMFTIKDIVQLRNTVILSLLFSLLCIDMSAQQPRQEKRIYLVDVTASMEGRGIGGTQDVFQKVKNSLISTLQRIEDERTDVVIIPFTSHTFPEFNGRIAQKDSLIQYISNLSIRKGDTNIADAWAKGVACVDSTKINYIFLLTDGLHNCGPDREVLYDRLRAWGEQSCDKYMFAFYVMLTPDAKEMEICNIVDETSNLWLIESMNIDASLITVPNLIRKNVFNDKTITLQFETNNSYVDLADIGTEFVLEDNSYYQIANVEMSLMSDAFKLDISEKLEKRDIPLTDTLILKIFHDRGKYPFVFFTPEQLKLVINNQGPRHLNVSERLKAEALPGSLSFGKLKFHEPFLGPFNMLRPILEPTLKFPPFSWFKPDTMSVARDLYLTFNEEAVRSASSVEIDFRDNESLPIKDINFDYGAQRIINAADSTIVLPVSIKVLPGRESSRCNGVLALETQGIDFVNGNELSSDQTMVCEWTLDYKRRGSVILWILWILCVLLIIYLIYWLLRFFFIIAGYIGSGISELAGAVPPVKNPAGRNPAEPGLSKQGHKQKNERNKNMNPQTCPCNKLTVPYCRKLISEKASIAEKCQDIVALADRWEEKKLESDAVYDRMCPEMRDLLERFWAIRKPIPSDKYGKWVNGTRGNGVFYFYSDYRPAEKNTRDGMTWAELVAAYRKDFNLYVDGGVRYVNNRIDIAPYAVAKLKIRYEDSNLNKIGSRGGSDDTFQQKAGDRFAEMLKDKIAAGGYKDFWEFKDGRKGDVLVRKTPLVIHEDYDGETLYLVPKYLHDNWKHYGGVALIEAVLNM